MAANAQGTLRLGFGDRWWEIRQVRQLASPLPTDAGHFRDLRVADQGRNNRLSELGAETPVPSNRDQIQAIREWAKSAGYEGSSRGQIARSIQDAFNAAH